MIASLKKINTWIAKHNPRWLALIRVGLGASLLLKGVDYLDHPTKMHDDFQILFPSLNLDIYATAVPWVHIVGGFLILLGLFTRFAAIIQIPILLVIIFFVNTHTAVFAKPEQFVGTIVQLLLLGLFIIEGSGKMSLAYYFKEADGEVTDDEEEE